MELLTEEIRAAFGAKIAFPPAARQALRLLAERAKIVLSDAEQSEFAIDLGDGRVFRRVLRRQELEALAAPLIERTLEACRRALRDAGGPEIDRVVLVGGSTRIPAVRAAFSTSADV